jgi:hypothetical protein
VESELLTLLRRLRTGSEITSADAPPAKALQDLDSLASSAAALQAQCDKYGVWAKLLNHASVLQVTCVKCNRHSRDSVSYMLCREYSAIGALERVCHVCMCVKTWSTSTTLK